MKELPVTWALAFSMTWAIFWRAVLVGLLPAIAWNLLVRQGNDLVQAIAPIVEIAIWFVVISVATHMVLKRGFGSLRLVFVEQAHYQQITSNK